jgi:hypothetical protein
MGVGTNVPVANVVTEYHQNVRLLTLTVCEGCSEQNYCRNRPHRGHEVSSVAHFDFLRNVDLPQRMQKDRDA